jgi:FkbM family methyltransferase
VTRIRQRLRLRRVARRLAAPKLLRAFAESYPEAFFVEIGANDGEQHDHLGPLVRSHPWRGIMVEPVPYIFERLRNNYAGIDRVILEHAAIADRDGRLPFYHLSEPEPDEVPDLPDWYDGIGSFSRETVLSHAPQIPDIEGRLVTAEVPCLTLDSLLRKHGVERVDLLVVDTEGYDYEILRSLDFTKHHPRLVVYEHFHLDPEQRDATRRRLEEAGYQTMEEGFDTFCHDPQRDDALTRAWRRARPGVAGVSKHDEAP